MSRIPVIEEPGTVRAVVVVQQDVACLIRFDGATPVGSLRWGLDDGVITMIEVHADHRRRGHATAMLRDAREVAQARGWAGPWHEPDWEQVSDEGRAWRASLGADANGGDANGDANGPSTPPER